MPIFVKPEWHQTPTDLIIKIPSYGINQNDIDILTHDNYIKAHYQQYIFEAFLFKSINVMNSTCLITDENITFELTKATEGEWERLEVELSKVEKKDLRNQIIKEVQEKTQEECKARSNKRSEIKRTGVKLQIEEDTKKHEMIKNLKKQEEEKALREMKLWEENQEKLLITDVKPKQQFKKSNDRSKYKSVDKAYTPIAPVEPAIPLPRKCQTISVSFTAREFPTPVRESKIPEEEEWLAKQAAARRSVGFDSDDLRPEERNPQWLLAKGNEFLKAENYLAAISAYSEGIKISREFVDLFIRRSEVHYLVKNYQKTIEDCSKALDIMKPEVPANLEMRIECIVRRANALQKIGMVRHSIAELEVALKLSPGNASIKKDLREAYMEYKTKKNKSEE